MKRFNFKFLISCLILLLGAYAARAITIESKVQEMYPDKNKGYFKENVKVQVGDVTVTSPRAELDLEPATKKPSIATFFDKPYAFQIRDNKKHEVKANIIKVSLINKVITAQGNAQMNVLENRNPTVIVTAQTQEYDTRTSVMTAEGSVVVNYQDVVATSDRASAVIDKKGDVHELELSSRATVKQNKNIVRGDYIKYLKSKNNITATGNTLSDVTLDGGERIIVQARSQQYDRGANTIMAVGDVTVKYANYIATGPKAIMNINAKTEKPESVTFLGRSKIVEKGANSVEANRITMTIQPREFKAEGNVKTIIEQTSNAQDSMEFSL